MCMGTLARRPGVERADSERRAALPGREAACEARSHGDATGNPLARHRAPAAGGRRRLGARGIAAGVAPMRPRARVRKAVFPVAGFGVRFLPATKACPKEMLPVVDRP